MEFRVFILIIIISLIFSLVSGFIYGSKQSSWRASNGRFRARPFFADQLLSMSAKPMPRTPSVGDAFVVEVSDIGGSMDAPLVKFTSSDHGSDLDIFMPASSLSAAERLALQVTLILPLTK